MDVRELTAIAPELVERIRAEGRAAVVVAERRRLLAIFDLPAAGLEQLRRRCMEDATCTPGEAAARILAARGEREQRMHQVAPWADATDDPSPAA